MLAVAVFASAMSAGCDEECPTGTWCQGNELWAGSGRNHWSCDDMVEEDCGAQGKVCMDDLPDNKPGCYYGTDSVKCPINVNSWCDGNTLVKCAEGAAVAVEKNECEDVCAAKDAFNAACTTPCAVNEQDFCHKENNSIMACVDGFQFLKRTCKSGTVCVDVPPSATGLNMTRGMCLRSPETWCPDDTDVRTACNENVGSYICGSTVDTASCPSGCAVFNDTDSAEYLYCDTDYDTDPWFR